MGFEGVRKMLGIRSKEEIAQQRAQEIAQRDEKEALLYEAYEQTRDPRIDAYFERRYGARWQDEIRSNMRAGVTNSQAAELERRYGARWQDELGI